MYVIEPKLVFSILICDMQSSQLNTSACNYTSIILYTCLSLISRTSQHRCYKLKNRLRLGEMWIAECNNKHSPAHRRDCSFIIGWPLVNCIAVFKSVCNAYTHIHVHAHVYMYMYMYRCTCTVHSCTNLY